MLLAILYVIKKILITCVEKTIYPKQLIIIKANVVMFLFVRNEHCGFTKFFLSKKKRFFSVTFLLKFV